MILVMVRDGAPLAARQPVWGSFGIETLCSNPARNFPYEATSQDPSILPIYFPDSYVKS